MFSILLTLQTLFTRVSERTIVCENFRKLDNALNPLKENVITSRTIYVSLLLCL